MCGLIKTSVLLNVLCGLIKTSVLFNVLCGLIKTSVLFNVLCGLDFVSERSLSALFQIELICLFIITAGRRRCSIVGTTLRAHAAWHLTSRELQNVGQIDRSSLCFSGLALVPDVCSCRIPRRCTDLRYAMDCGRMCVP